MAETITFQAAVYKVSTLVDSGIRVTLDLPETAIAEAAMLMECQRQGVVLDVSAVPNVSKITRLEDGKPTKGRKRAVSARAQDFSWEQGRPAAQGD